jgi:hypothetical protein
VRILLLIFALCSSSGAAALAEDASAQGSGIVGVWGCADAVARRVAHTWLYWRQSDGSSLISDSPSLIPRQHEKIGAKQQAFGDVPSGTAYYAAARPWITLAPKEATRMTYRFLTSDSLQLQSDGVNWWNGAFTCTRL